MEPARTEFEDGDGFIDPSQYRVILLKYLHCHVGRVHHILHDGLGVIKVLVAVVSALNLIDG